MRRFILTRKSVLKAFLVRLCGKIAVSGSGAALLDAQITDLEKRCAAIRNRIDRRHHRAESKRRNGHGTDRHPKMAHSASTSSTIFSAADPDFVAKTAPLHARRAPTLPGRNVVRMVSMDGGANDGTREIIGPRARVHRASRLALNLQGVSVRRRATEVIHNSVSHSQLALLM